MPNKLKLVVCTKGKSCKKRGAKKVFCELESQIEDFGLEKKICLKKSKCLGYCGQGPAIEVKPLDHLYGWLEPEDCFDLVKALKKKRKPVKRLLLAKHH